MLQTLRNCPASVPRVGLQAALYNTKSWNSTKSQFSIFSKSVDHNSCSKFYHQLERIPSSTISLFSSNINPHLSLLISITLTSKKLKWAKLGCCCKALFIEQVNCAGWYWITCSTLARWLTLSWVSFSCFPYSRRHGHKHEIYTCNIPCVDEMVWNLF